MYMRWIIAHTVVLLEQLLGGGGHLQGDQAETLGLEAIDDLADETALDAVRPEVGKRKLERIRTQNSADDCFRFSEMCSIVKKR